MGLVAEDATVMEAAITRTWEPVPAPSHQARDVSTSGICHFLGYSAELHEALSLWRQICLDPSVLQILQHDVVPVFCNLPPPPYLHHSPALDP